MKAIASFLSLLLLLCSCAKIPNVSEETDNDTLIIESTSVVTQALPDTTVNSTAFEEPIAPLPICIGIYDDLNDNGIYTRLSQWESRWTAGKDIAVFDIIPSSEDELQGRSYPKLWLQEAEKLPKDIDPDPYFILEYTLKDGTLKTKEIFSYAEAEELITEGYIEIYLYDDIANASSDWYSHLTKFDTDENTVISSVKLTAGKLIGEIESIKLTACNEGSSEVSVIIKAS